MSSSRRSGKTAGKKVGRTPVNLPQRKRRSLDEIYASLPALKCKGLCQECCGPIGCAPVEHARMIGEGGRRGTVRRLPSRDVMLVDETCAYLGFSGRCEVYSNRPIVCRLWGIVESLPCRFGCVPEGGHLPDERGVEILVEAMQAGGAMRDVRLPNNGFMFDPETRNIFRAVIRDGLENERRAAKRRGR